MSSSSITRRSPPIISDRELFLVSIRITSMFCDACGTEFKAGQRFCTSCAKPITGFGATPAIAAGGRVSRHIHIVGILTLIGSSIGMLWGAALLTVSSHHRLWLLRPWERLPLPYLFGLWIFISACAGFAAGWGLLQRAPWARTLALVMNSLAILYIPFGTMLGIYTLWVLLPPESELEYHQPVPNP